MKWKYCNYCPLDGTCENQDRGYECEMPIKKLLEENQQLKKDNRIFEEKIHNSYLKIGQLKELLLVCREMLEEYQFSEGDFTITIGDYLEVDTSLLLKMIDNAIGEKK